MAQCGVADAPIYVGCDREGRIHQHDGRAHRRIKVIVNVRGIVPANRKARKQLRQEIGARVGQLVEDEPGSGKFGKDSQQAGAGRRFEHHVIGRDGRRSRDEAECDRC